MRILMRVLVLVVAAFGLSVAGAGLAAAEPYPIVGSGATVSASTVTVGDTVQVTASGYTPGETVSVDVAYQPVAVGQLGRAATSGFNHAVARAPVATVVANSAGVASVSLQLTQAGVAVITLTGRTSGVTNTARVVVLSAGAAGSLPITGTNGHDLWMTVLIGLSLVVIGAAVVLLARFRRRPSHR